MTIDLYVHIVSWGVPMKWWPRKRKEDLGVYKTHQTSHVPDREVLTKLKWSNKRVVVVRAFFLGGTGLAGLGVICLLVWGALVMGKSIFSSDAAGAQIPSPPKAVVVAKLQPKVPRQKVDPAIAQKSHQPSPATKTPPLDTAETHPMFESIRQIYGESFKTGNDSVICATVLLNGIRDGYLNDYSPNVLQEAKAFVYGDSRCANVIKNKKLKDSDPLVQAYRPEKRKAP